MVNILEGRLYKHWLTTQLALSFLVYIHSFLVEIHSSNDRPLTGENRQLVTDEPVEFEE